MTVKKERSSSVRNSGRGEPFASILLRAVGIPVFLPSTRCNSFRKSPILRFLYLLERICNFMRSSSVMERSGPWGTCNFNTFFFNANRNWFMDLI